MTRCPYPPSHATRADPADLQLPVGAIGQCADPACLLLYRVVDTAPYRLEPAIDLSRFVTHALANAEPRDDARRQESLDAAAVAILEDG